MSVQGSLIGAGALVLAASLLSGCASYDYLQRTDQISYHAGNAVAANLEQETITPWSWSMYDTSGLGKNGSVIPGGTSTTTTTTTPTTPSTTAPTTSPQ